MEKFRLLATTAFGVEGITKKEVKKLGFENIKVEDGKVFFDSDKAGIVKANLWLRTASKVLLVVDEFKTYEFSDLYEKIYEIPWQEYIGSEDIFPVLGNSVKSKLYSVPSIQSISKKAIVDKLKDAYKTETLPEIGTKYEIKVSILKDSVLVTLNTSGEGLHRRGYRLEKNEAPLRETLASTLVYITNWNSKIPLVDPLCGTGTLLIEAALYGLNIAPGLSRRFQFEKWNLVSEEIIEEERKLAESQIRDRELTLIGYDIDEEVIEIARANAERAGVSEFIKFEDKDLKNFETDITYGYLLTNPPYGERLGTREEAKYINELLGKISSELDTWSKYIFTAYDGFEDVFGEPSTKNRKLFNGKLQCYFYQYYGPRPPKQG